MRHLPVHVPDIWIVLAQLLDIRLDLVFFLLSNDIGNVVYGGEEPVGVRALWTKSHMKTSGTAAPAKAFFPVARAWQRGVFTGVSQDWCRQDRLPRAGSRVLGGSGKVPLGALPGLALHFPSIQASQTLSRALVLCSSIAVDAGDFTSCSLIVSCASSLRGDLVPWMPEFPQNPINSTLTSLKIPD